MAEGRHIATRSTSSLRGRPWSWITGRPRLVDGLVVGFNLLGAFAGVAALFFRPGLPDPSALLAVAVVFPQAIALWWRRSHSALVLAVVVVLLLAQWLVSVFNGPSNAALVFAVYAVSVYGRPKVRLWIAGIAIVVMALAVASLIFDKFDIARELMPVAAPSLVAWVIGDYIRSRRQFLADLVERNRRERESAADAERLRIARELHDVVAHNVSLMAIQAGAARVSGDSSPAALQTIETTARDTLAELNRLLGVLRKDPDGVARDPQPSLAQVEALMKPARESGMDATLKVIGDKRQLPAALDLSAYRIVQEALTNVLKHAHATRVEVLIDYESNAVVLTVTDNGNGADASVGASRGHGLIGMRERVELFGGELSAEPSSLGGFTVRARLPIS